MEKLTINQLNMLGKVNDLLTVHLDKFPPDSLGGKTIAQLQSAKTHLDALGAFQVRGQGTAKEGTAWKAAARVSLLHTLEAVERTAAAIALDTPGFDDKFHVPPKPSAQVLLATANAFLQEATPLSTAFIAHATPQNFLDRLKADIDNFQQAIGEKAKGKKTHVDATAAMKTTLKKGLAAVKRLDAIVRNTLAGDTEAIGAWERATQVERVGRHSKGQPATTAPAPPATANPPAPSAVVTPLAATSSALSAKAQ